MQVQKLWIAACEEQGCDWKFVDESRVLVRQEASSHKQYHNSLNKIPCPNGHTGTSVNRASLRKRYRLGVPIEVEMWWCYSDSRRYVIIDGKSVWLSDAQEVLQGVK